MTIWIILLFCIFFTIVVLKKPDFMWSILAAVSWFILFWYTRDNPIAGIDVGSTGDIALIGICIGAIVFVLLYTINDTREKKKKADAESGASKPRAGSTGESSDSYYDRMSRLTTKKK